MSDAPTHDLPFGLPLPEVTPSEKHRELVEVDPDSAHRIEVGIPMRDGVELAADVFLPPASQRPAPAVISGTPYDKSNPVGEDAAVWQQAGYVGISYDVRGRGKSEGEWQPYEREPEDGYDVVEWAAAQDWCDGRVGVTGISYLGGVVWRTMAARPPHLKAAISTAPEGRWQDECPYQHGCFWLYYEYWWSLVRRRIFDRSRDVAAMVETLPVRAMTEMLDPAGPGWAEVMDHDTLDELWRRRRWDGEFDYDVPTLHVGGWHDRDAPHGLFYHYQEMIKTSPARDKQWLLVGPWTHGGARSPEDEFCGVSYPGAGVDMDAIHVRFMDRFLKGEENGVDEEPAVRLYDPGRKEWQARDGWTEGTRVHDLFLASDGELGEEAGEDGSESYRYDPMNAPGLRFDVSEMWVPGIDLGALVSQEGVVAWTTPPLAEDLTVRGWSELELWAETDGEDTEWHAKVADLEPDGRLLQVTWGCLRASYGDDETNPQPVTPGEAKRYAIELTPAFHTFKAGHRIRLLLASSDYPFFARSMNRFGHVVDQDDPRVATNTVHHGAARPSRLKLTVEGG